MFKSLPLKREQKGLVCSLFKFIFDNRVVMYVFQILGWFEIIIKKFSKNPKHDEYGNQCFMSPMSHEPMRLTVNIAIIRE